MLECLVGLGKGGQCRLETLIELGQARVIALGQQVETALRHVLEPLVGLQARQTQGRPAFEREQIAGVAQEVGDDLISFGLWRCAGVPRRGALGGGRRGLFERTWQQAGHGQDAAWPGSVRESCRSTSPTCWRTVWRRAILKAASASARGSARLRR